jgi:hypothetical protein
MFHLKGAPPQADAAYMLRPSRAVAVLIGVLLASLAGTAWAGKDEKPVVTGTSPQDVTTSSATLKGTVNPNGHPTTYLFEYGLTTAYGSQTPEGSAGKTKSAQPVTVAVSGLDPDTTYHFRVVATNDHGTTYGPDQPFTTLAVPTDPGGGSGGSGSGSGTPDSRTPAAVPEPKLGSSVLVAPASGELRVRLPGTSTFKALELGSKLPVGSEIDARKGSLALTAALPGGKTETGYFGAGRFTLRQDKRGYVDLYLRGKYCSAGSTASVASAARRKPGRRLWGRDHGGRFRTHGRNSHATVRGTRWLVVDTCKGTYTRVSKGEVVVRDTVRHKRVVLKAGEHYLARPRH